jgi:hypothetical protein
VAIGLGIAVVGWWLLCAGGLGDGAGNVGHWIPWSGSLSSLWLKLSGLGRKGVSGAVWGTGDKSMLGGRLRSDVSSISVSMHKRSSMSGLELLLAGAGVLLVLSSGGGVRGVPALAFTFAAHGGRTQIGGVILCSYSLYVCWPYALCLA